MTSHKLFATFFMGMAIMLSTATDSPPIDTEPRQKKDHSNIRDFSQPVRLCDDFGAEEVTLRDTISFLTDIQCNTPQVLHVESEVLVRSHADINTTNVLFVIHKEGNLTVSSKGGITLARDLTITTPIMTISGEVTLQADGRPLSPIDGSTEDTAQLVHMIGSGHLKSESTLHYSATSILATGTSSFSNEATMHGEPMQPLQDPALQAALIAIHATLAADPFEPSAVGDNNEDPNDSASSPAPYVGFDSTSAEGMMEPAGAATDATVSAERVQDDGGNIISGGSSGCGGGAATSTSNSRGVRSFFRPGNHAERPTPSSLGPSPVPPFRGTSEDASGDDVLSRINTNPMKSPPSEAQDALIIDDDWMRLNSCDQILNDTLEAVTHFDLHGSILCEAPRLIKVLPGHHTMVRSAHDLILQNVFFSVPKNARLSLKAKRAIFLERDEDFINNPTFFLDGGKLSLHAEGWSPRYMSGGSVDTHEMVRAVADGQVLSHQEIKYTKTSMAVATIGKAQRKALRRRDLWDTTSQTSADLDPALQLELDGILSSRTAHHEGFPPEKSHHQHHHQHQQRNPDKMSKSTAKSTTDMSTANELSRPLNAGYPPSQGPKTAPRTRPLPRKDRDGTTVPDLSAPPGVKHETDDMTKTRWISKRGTSTAGHRPFTPAWISKPDSISLKVGEKLKSPLKSSDGKSTISLGIDGSIRFRKELPEAEGASRDVDYGNSDTDAPKVLSTTLVPSDKRKAVRVLEARLAPKDERAAEETLHGRRKLRDWSGPRALKRWLEEVTRPDIAEVEMTVTNRGCVEVTMDNKCVISKAGHRRLEWMNRFPWQRRKDDGYELRATGDGLEVKRGGKTIWGLTASDLE